MLIIIDVYFEIDKCNDVKRNIVVNRVTIESHSIYMQHFAFAYCGYVAPYTISRLTRSVCM